MDTGTASTQICPSPEIAAYIDGELDLGRELGLERHFSQCDVCAGELNDQKQFLLCLDASLKNEDDLELPAGFTKAVIVNAEANVSGLRRPSELYNALFVCAGVGLFVLFAAGASAREIMVGVYAAAEQATVVATFFGHFVYDVFFGVVVVMRSFAAQFQPDVVMTVLLSVLLFVPTVILSRKMLRVGRA